MIDSKIESLLDTLGSELMLINPTDLQAVKKIIDMFTELAEVDTGSDKELGEFVRTVAGKSVSVAEDMMVELSDDAKISIDALTGVVTIIQTAFKNGTAQVKFNIPERLNLNLSTEDAKIDPVLMEFVGNQDSVLSEIENLVLAAEKEGDLSSHLRALKGIFHTTKGEAGLLELKDLSHLCHAVEDFLDSAGVDGFADKMLPITDWMRSRFDSILGKAETPEDVELIISRVLTVSEPETERDAETAADKNRKVTKKKTGMKSKSDNAQIADEDEKEETGKVNKAEEKKETPAAATAAEPVKQRKAFVPGEGDESLLCDFLSEAQGHLDSADVQLLKIESAPQDKEALNAVFRSFHTIKGVAGFLDLMDIQELAHISEDVLDNARKDRLELSGGAIDTIFEAVDFLRRLLGQIEEALSSGGVVEPDPTLPALLSRIRSLKEGNVDPCPIGVEKQAEAVPAEKPVTKKLGEILVEKGKVAEEKLKGVLAEKDSNIRLGEELIKRKEVSARDVAGALREQRNTRENKEGVQIKETVKIDTERLDRLLDAIGELVVAESMVGQNDEIRKKISPTVARNLGHLSKITRLVQELGMSMRMETVQPTFQKMNRLVRDVARKNDKQVDFVTGGEDTELDRSVIERIGDPLIHLLRNAVDHGLEGTEERKAAGKSPVGQVKLEAFHRGGNIYIEVSDDGRGLDKDKLCKKAVEKGLITENAELSDSEIYNLIFAPGFSTAQKVTDVSGRGVGMDVVKRNIESLRGTININTELGRGTTVSMRLPLTLAIIDGMIIEVATERYIIPTLSVLESIQPNAKDLSTVTGKGELLNVRGELLPLFRVANLFNLSGALEDPTQAITIIVEDQQRRVALLIDRLIGQRQVVIKNLGEGLGKIHGISGGAIMSDGSVGLILDITEITKLANGKTNKKKSNAAA